MAVLYPAKVQGRDVVMVIIVIKIGVQLILDLNHFVIADPKLCKVGGLGTFSC